ncbi:PREDICTED: nucleolin [Nelumbo nucifera]|uniref:Nucleolin n=2 Tax=Nelumbo nucifera TaxID=4432 RepID=A0A1U7ZH95_NELNU|nr:PREDICTED: nucleolin [Nelumbo nucifera]DAD34337.1 TPA_asm: hypothetical protein HUJ06_004977 [Nelumbo nucifera]
MSNKRVMSREKNRDKDEVEELLRAAEEEMLLKLSVNSHMARASSSPLDRDLAHRFEALKKPSAPPGITKVRLPPKQPIVKTKEDDELNRILGADLSARFGALKGSSSSVTESQMSSVRSDGGDGVDDKEDDEDEDGASKSEVEKLIQWAMDAARLDPSRSDDDEEEEEEEDDNDEDKRGKQQRKK